MIITKLKERPKYKLDDDGNQVEEKQPKINRAEVTGLQANKVFTQVLIETKEYLVKNTNLGFTQHDGLPYIIINYNDNRTEQFMFDHQCGEISVSSALSEDNKIRQYAVWLWSWPSDFVEIKEFTVNDESGE